MKIEKIRNCVNSFVPISFIDPPKYNDVKLEECEDNGKPEEMIVKDI